MISGIMNQKFLGNSVLAYIISLGVFIVGLFVMKIFKIFILKRMRKYAEKTRTTLDDFLIKVISKIVIPLLYFGVFYLAVNMLKLAPFLRKIVTILGLAIMTIFITQSVVMFIDYLVINYLKKRGKDATLQRSLSTSFRIVKFIIWALAIVFFLDNLGFKISTVIAGLGIGGIAVGLAAQAILKDLFSYFSIIFDRPFEVGDFIIVEDLLGTVEYIGAKTTRIRSLGGEQLVFSNTDLTDSRIRNYKRMEKRRVVFQFGVVYQTPFAKLKQIPQIVRNIIESIDDTVFDRAHFLKYGDSSLVFEVVYYVKGSDYNKYMDIQQEINLGLFEEFEKQGIEFAYPTQTLYINKIG